MSSLRIAFFSFLVVFAGAGSAFADEHCGKDKSRDIQVPGACFVVETRKGNGDVLVVFIHGDSGVRRNYLEQFERLTGKGVNLVVLARPGYDLRDGRRTWGISQADYDNYTPEIVDAIADVIGQLRVFHQASRVVLVGHSGGSMISGILLGRHPGVAKAAVLIGWACNTSEWREWRIWSAGRNSRWTSSLSAHDFLGKVPAATKVIAITGEKDDNTKAEFAEVCVNGLKNRGIDARLEIVPGAGHSSVFGTEQVTAAVLEVIQ